MLITAKHAEYAKRAGVGGFSRGSRFLAAQSFNPLAVPPSDTFASNQYSAFTLIVAVPAGAIRTHSDSASKTVCGWPLTVTVRIGLPSGWRRRSTIARGAGRAGGSIVAAM